MCKYSFDAIPTRLANEGEEIIIHKFLDGSTGFASAGKPERPYRPTQRTTSEGGGFGRILKKLLAMFRAAEPSSSIYVPFGTRLILKDIPSEIQKKFGIGCEEGVIFVPINGRFDFPHDGLRFANGCQVYLRDLPEGTPLEVLSLAETEFALYEQELETSTKDQSS